MFYTLFLNILLYFKLESFFVLLLCIVWMIVFSCFFRPIGYFLYKRVFAVNTDKEHQNKILNFLTYRLDILRQLIYGRSWNPEPERKSFIGYTVPKILFGRDVFYDTLAKGRYNFLALNFMDYWDESSDIKFDFILFWLWRLWVDSCFIYYTMFVAWVVKWPFSGSPKKIGIIYLFIGVLVMLLLFSGWLFLVYTNNVSFLDKSLYFVTLFFIKHGYFFYFYSVIPIFFLGFGNFFLPTMVGKTTTYFSNLGALSLWFFIKSFLLFIIAHFLEIFALEDLYFVISSVTSRDRAVSILLLISSIYYGIAIIINSLNFLYTVITSALFISKGFGSVPMFAWSALFCSVLFFILFWFYLGCSFIISLNLNFCFTYIFNFISTKDIILYSNFYYVLSKVFILFTLFIFLGSIFYGVMQRNHRCALITHTGILSLIMPAFFVYSASLIFFNISPWYFDTVLLASIFILQLTLYTLLALFKRNNRLNFYSSSPEFFSLILFCSIFIVSAISFLFLLAYNASFFRTNEYIFFMFGVMNFNYILYGGSICGFFVSIYFWSLLLTKVIQPAEARNLYLFQSAEFFLGLHLFYGFFLKLSLLKPISNDFFTFRYNHYILFIFLILVLISILKFFIFILEGIRAREFYKRKDRKHYWTSTRTNAKHFYRMNRFYRFFYNIKWYELYGTNKPFRYPRGRFGRTVMLFDVAKMPKPEKFWTAKHLSLGLRAKVKNWWQVFLYDRWKDKPFPWIYIRVFKGWRRRKVISSRLNTAKSMISRYTFYSSELAARQRCFVMRRSLNLGLSQCRVKTYKKIKFDLCCGFSCAGKKSRILKK